jgi:murein DD-endopeptidase MepM/ murein hydrolase activator NlpD
LPFSTGCASLAGFINDNKITHSLEVVVSSGEGGIPVQGKNRFYTLIIAPATSSQFYKIILHHRQVVALAAGSLMVLVLLIGAVVWMIRQAGLLESYHQIQGENQALKQEYFSTLKNLQSRMASLEAESQQLRQLAQELGVETGESSSATEDKPLFGAGGPADLHSVSGELDRMESHLRLLRRNLTTERSRIVKKPKGWPAYGRMTSGFGMRRNPFGSGYEFHSGQDIGASYGTPVRATAAGIVTHAGYRAEYGLLVVLDHGRGVTTHYGHLSRVSVSAGQRIKRGDQVGRVGSTGRSTSSHVHYEVRLNDRPINPKRPLP